MGSILLMGAGLQTTVTGPTYDPDAQLFFNAQTAAGVTLTTTEKDAVNQWVVDAKAAGIWTKFKAIYPFVGSTATSQKFNLKNPADTNAAYRLVFSGGGTHSSNGYSPGGVNGYANTFLNSLSNLTGTSTHLSYYSRTATPVNTTVEIGCGQVVPPYCALAVSVARAFDSGEEGGVARANFTTTTNAQGFWLGTKRSNTDRENYLNGISQTTKTVSDTLAFPNLTLYLGAINRGTPNLYSSKQCAFASIGDGLTDLEAQLFYQITEKYQVALGRNVNALQSFYYNPAYNNETNAFLFSTQITDNTIQTATNTLVSDLKTANIFTKMKAIYPMVGGTATTCKFNLVNAQDTDAAFRLTFFGGGTFSANGYLPNGVNAYANTFCATDQMALNSIHLSYYSRNNALAGQTQIGASKTTVTTTTSGLNMKDAYIRLNQSGSITSVTNATTLGLHVATRTASNLLKLNKNGTVIGTWTNVSSIVGTFPLYIGANNQNNSIINSYTTAECAFASIGDGLTDAEALALYNAVQLFNTTLARQV